MKPTATPTKPGPGDQVLAPGASPGGASGAAGSPTFLKPTHKWQRSAGWISIGVAAALATTGAVLATSASSREDDIRRLLEFQDPESGLPSAYSGNVKSQYDDAKSEGSSLSRWAKVAFIGAGVAVSAATVFFILDLRGPKVPDDEEAR